MDQAAALILDQSKVLLMAFGLGFARWFAFASVFAMFVWAGVSGGLVRNAIAIGFGLPMTLMLFVGAQDTLATMPAMAFVLLMAKEVLLGLLLGLIASGPVWIADLVGGVLAGLRQEEGAGSGFGSTATAQIFVLLAVGLLAYEGGFRLLIGAVYQSYVGWPVLAPMPVLGAQAGEALLQLMTLVFKAGFVIVGPFLIVFLLIDASVGIAARLGKNIDLSPYADLFKSIALIGLIFATIPSLADAITASIRDFSNLNALLRPFFAASPP